MAAIMRLCGLRGHRADGEADPTLQLSGLAQRRAVLCLGVMVPPATGALGSSRSVNPTPCP